MRLPFSVCRIRSNKKTSVNPDGGTARRVNINNKQTDKGLYTTRCTPDLPLQKSLQGNFKQNPEKMQQKSSILLYLKRSLSSFKPISLQALP